MKPEVGETVIFCVTITREKNGCRYRSKGKLVTISPCTSNAMDGKNRRKEKISQN